MIPRALRRLVLRTVVAANTKGKLLAIRLTRWTGKSREYVHPKHLLGDGAEHYWYLPHVPAGATVLDIGCGHGVHAVRLAARGARVLGLDANVASLGVARRLAIARGIDGVLVACVDVEAGLPVATASVDVVLCLDVLEHLVKRDATLREIRRVLGTSGILLLALPNRATSWKRRLERAGLFAYADPDHKVEYTLDEMRDELARNGFTIVQLYPTVYDTPLTGAIDVIGGVSLGLYRRLTRLRARLAARYPEENAGFFAVCAPR
jgi:2-polyprenyl-3-methyl-5-hydroxy-6-metoxy-1,4-benzoquinol methylase